MNERNKIIENKNYTNNYFLIMDTIKTYLKISQLKIINRYHENYIEEGYEVRTDKKESCEILIKYLSTFPLFSSKHLDFLDWLKIIEVKKENKNKIKTMKYSNFILNIKNNMNNSRNNFNWKHLDKFYNI